MTQLIDVDAERRDQMLMDAADRNTQVVLSHRPDGVWLTYKSHILHADFAGRFLILSHPLHAPGTAPPELVGSERIGLAFRRGHKKCLCAAEVVRQLQYELAEGQMVPALQVHWPEQIQEMQRRVYFRAAVPPGRRIEVRLWEGGLPGEQPSHLQCAAHHTGLLQDISAGGLRLRMDAHRDPGLQEGETVGVEFQPDPRSRPVRVEAVFRHKEQTADRKLALGFQIVGLETMPNGRKTLQVLSRVVSVFLRIEMRKKNAHPQKPRRRRQ